MDLIETTFKVMEDKTLIEENVSAFKDNLNQYAQYIDQLKEFLEETESVSSQNKGFLEINNLSKDAFNENFKESKALCGLIYGYLRQIEENLSNLAQKETSLNELFNENCEHIKRVDAKFTNALQTLNDKKKQTSDRFLEDGKKIQEEINSSLAEIKQLEQLYESLQDTQQDKQNTLQLLKVEIELLEDKLEIENAEIEELYKEQKNYSDKKINIINTHSEVQDKILVTQEILFNSYEKFKEVTEQKKETLQKQIETLEIFKELEKQCSDLEKQISELENQQKQRNENLMRKIDEKKMLLNENEKKMLSDIGRISEIEKEMEKIKVMEIAVDEKLTYFQNIFDAEQDTTCENNNLQFTQEYENLMANSKKLLNMTSETENKIKEKREMLKLLKTTPNVELIDLQDKLQALEKEFQNSAIQKELDDIDLRNKNLQKNIEQYETDLKELNFKNLKFELDRNENEEKLKVLTVKCENAEKEILRLETSKQENIKLFSKPPLKRNTSPKIKKTHTSKKRAFMDVGSDSSVDGERLSYAEFMAKKRNMREKRQKRTDTSSIV